MLQRLLLRFLEETLKVRPARGMQNGQVQHPVAEGSLGIGEHLAGKPLRPGEITRRGTLGHQRAQGQNAEFAIGIEQFQGDAGVGHNFRVLGLELHHGQRHPGNRVVGLELERLGIVLLGIAQID